MYDHFNNKKAKVSAEMRVKIHLLNIRGLQPLSRLLFTRWLPLKQCDDPQLRVEMANLQENVYFSYYSQLSNQKNIF